MYISAKSPTRLQEVRYALRRRRIGIRQLRNGPPVAIARCQHADGGRRHSVRGRHRSADYRVWSSPTPLLAFGLNRSDRSCDRHLDLAGGERLLAAVAGSCTVRGCPTPLGAPACGWICDSRPDARHFGRLSVRVGPAAHPVLAEKPPGASLDNVHRLQSTTNRPPQPTTSRLNIRLLVQSPTY